jgi:thioredoxin reductase
MRTKVAIIGAGPAGMAAALQLKRYNIEALLFEKDKKTGSLLKNAWQVENYLGFPKAKSGPELLRNFQRHLAQYDIHPIIEDVKIVDYHNEFFIKTNNKNYSAEYLVIASGTKPKEVPLQSDFCSHPRENGDPESRGEVASPLLDSRVRGNDVLRGNDFFSGNDSYRGQVYYEIFPLLKEHNKIIAIIGAGDTACDYALNLAANNQVFLINRIKKIKALPLLIDKVQQNQNIIYKENHALQRVAKGSEKNFLLTFTNGFIVEADLLLAAIGRIPQKDFYAANLIENENQLISTGYLHLAGDVKNDIYRQTSIAVADGVYVAMKIYKHITGELCK